MASITRKTKTKNNSVADLRELFVIKIQILYDVEFELVKTLPAMAKKTNDADLKGVFEDYADQAEAHVEQLRRICQMLGVKAEKLQNKGIRGLIADAEWATKNVKNAAALDAALVANVRSIAHYGIAGYETVVAWAKILEKDEIADLLEQALEENNDTNEELDDLAELKINERAMPEGFVGDTEDGDDDEEEKNKT